MIFCGSAAFQVSAWITNIGLSGARLRRNAGSILALAVAGRAAENAPLTSQAFKETARRITQGNLPDTSDLIERVYGSADFKRGVATFLGKTRTLPDWTGD